MMDLKARETRERTRKKQKAITGGEINPQNININT